MSLPAPSVELALYLLCTGALGMMAAGAIVSMLGA